MSEKAPKRIDSEILASPDRIARKILGNRDPRKIDTKVADGIVGLCFEDMLKEKRLEIERLKKEIEDMGEPPLDKAHQVDSEKDLS